MKCTLLKQLATEAWIAIYGPKRQSFICDTRVQAIKKEPKDN